MLMRWQAYDDASVQKDFDNPVLDNMQWICWGSTTMAMKKKSRSQINQRQRHKKLC